MVVICQMLAKKVDTLTKAMEVEAKKMRREVASMEKEVAAMRVEKEQESRAKRSSNVKGTVNSAQHQLVSGRYHFVFVFWFNSCAICSMEYCVLLFYK